MKKTGDSAAAIKTKVKALLARMTLEEKIAQLGSVFATPLLENGKFSPAKAKEVLKNGIGHISAPAMSSGLPLREVTALNNAIQQFLREIRCFFSFHKSLLRC